MTIYSWTRNHFGNSALGWIIFAATTFFVVFELWSIFGGIYLFYMLLLFGVSQILIDFFFITAGAPQAKGMESPVSSGKEIAARQAHMAHAQRSFAQGFMRR